MSYTAVNKAVAAAVMDGKLAVVNDLVAFLETKIEVDEDLKAIFEEFKANLKESEEKIVKDAGKKTKASKKDSSDGEKKKRAPSVFNLYVKDVMPAMKAKHPDIKDGKQMIAFASESWKNDPMGPYIKEKVAEMKKDDKDADIVELYAKAKAMYNDENGIEEKAVTDDEVEEKPKAKKGAAKKPVTDDDEEKPKTKKGAAKKPVTDDDEEKPKAKKASAKKVKEIEVVESDAE